MKKAIKLLVIGALSIGCLSTAFAQKATISEQVVTMGTYPFGDPDPVANPEKSFYPYYRHDGFSTTKSSREWKSVTLENDYIKVVMFPEIGGKVWTAIDKTNGKEFLYNNDVVKFRDIAMCGAWASGGIEFNFGIIGHAPTTADPVDYIIVEKADGSVSCYISSIELLTKSTWQVEVNLQPDKAYFTTNVVWFNSSTTKEPYYQWMNAAIPAANDLQFFYPGTNHIGHEGDLHPYPIENGVDISWYKNNAFGADKSYHVIGAHSNFFAGYYHNSEFGSVHHSDYHAKLGQKIWIWSHSRAGAIWENLLTDGAGQYVEVQSGRMFNQPRKRTAYTPFKNEDFMPGITDSWTEYWYPIHNTKGVAQAASCGALNVVRKEGRIELYFSPTEDIDTTIKLYDGEKMLWSGALKAKPLQAWSTEISCGDIAEGNLRIIVGDNKLIYAEAKNENLLNRPKLLPADFDWNSAYGLYVLGEQDYNSKIWGRAEQRLEAAISKDKYLVPAMHALANLYYKTGRYDKALEMACRALSLNTYDADANYIYGLVNLALGNIVDAKDGLSIAARKQDFRSVANTARAGIYIAERDWNKALFYNEEALAINPANMRALQQKLQCLRNLGKRECATKLVNSLLEKYPLNHSLRFEKCMLQPTANALAEFKSLIRSRQQNESYQELADSYLATNSYNEVVTLLSCAENHAMATYLRAWALHKLGSHSEAEKVLQQAEKMDLSLVFPSRASHLPALKWAAEMTNSWRPLYLQALLLHYNLQKEEAMVLLDKCGDKADFAPFYLYRASLRNGELRLADLHKAESLEKSWRCGKAIVQYYCDKGEWETAYNTASEYNRLYKTNGALNVQYALTMVHTGRYADAHKVLDKSEILPYEGATYSYDIYHRSYIFEAISLILKGKGAAACKCIEKSKLYPENLGVGKPYDDVIAKKNNNYSLEKFLERCSHLERSEATKELKNSTEQLVKEYFDIYKK